MRHKLTPADLRERRRDRDLRKTWMRHLHAMEKEKLQKMMPNFAQSMLDFPAVAPAIAKAMVIVTEKIAQRHWFD